MRVVVVGDTHADIEWMTAVTEVAGRHSVEVIFQVGDFGYWPNSRTRSGGPFRRHLLGGISDACRLFGVREWVFIEGNHDDHGALADHQGGDIAGPDTQGMWQIGPCLRYSPRGNTFEIGGTRFATLGGAASIDALLEQAGVDLGGPFYEVGRNWFPDLEGPTRGDVERLVGQKVDVLLTHEAPSGVDMSAFNGFPGTGIPPEVLQRCAEPRDLVAAAARLCKPELLIHGHWHARHSTTLEFHQNTRIRIEGLASNQSGNGRDGRAYVLLDLPDLTVIDGTELGPVPTHHRR